MLMLMLLLLRVLLATHAVTVHHPLHLTLLVAHHLPRTCVLQRKPPAPIPIPDQLALGACRRLRSSGRRRHVLPQRHLAIPRLVLVLVLVLLFRGIGGLRPCRGRRGRNARQLRRGAREEGRAFRACGDVVEGDGARRPGLVADVSREGVGRVVFAIVVLVAVAFPTRRCCGGERAGAFADAGGVNRVAGRVGEWGGGREGHWGRWCEWVRVRVRVQVGA